MIGSRISAAAMAVAGVFPAFTHAAEPAAAPSVQPASEVSPESIVAQAPSGSGVAATGPSSSPPTTLGQVVVTAATLREARIDLSPKVGTTVYTIDQGLIDSLGQGGATSFDEVLLHLPGVDKDSKASGSLHVRDDHGNVQYRINGVKLPENISGFGQSIDTRFVDRIDFLPHQAFSSTSRTTTVSCENGFKIGPVRPRARGRKRFMTMFLPT